MKKSEKIKAVVFDLGRVLLDFDHLIAAQRISQFCNKSGEEIYQLFFDSVVTNSFERGKISAQDLYVQIKETLDLKLSYESFVPIWNEIFFLSPKNRWVYRIANFLKQDYTLCLLSNINFLHHEYIKERFPVLSIFEKIYLSYQLGLAKPDKEIYRHVISDLNLSPDEIFYCDDRAELVDSAISLGIKGFVFKSHAKLIKDLSSMDIIIPFSDGNNP